MQERQNEVISITALEKVPENEKKSVQTQDRLSTKSPKEIHGRHRVKVSNSRGI